MGGPHKYIISHNWNSHRAQPYNPLLPKGFIHCSTILPKGTHSRSGSIRMVPHNWFYRFAYQHVPLVKYFSKFSSATIGSILQPVSIPAGYKNNIFECFISPFGNNIPSSPHLVESLEGSASSVGMVLGWIVFVLFAVKNDINYNP